MLRPFASLLLLAGVTGAAFVPSSAVAGERPNAIERYGLGGFIQPIGLHHGFHIEKVVPDSPAARDRLAPHDIIVKVDGEEIRSLEHLRTLMTDIDEDDGDAELTIIKNGGLEHHVVKCHLKARGRSTRPEGSPWSLQGGGSTVARGVRRSTAIGVAP